MDVLGIGQSVYDLTFVIDGDIVLDNKYRSKKMIECMGGPCTNAIYFCGLWGLDCQIISRVGSDLYGNNIIDSFKKIKVMTDSIFVSKQNTSISCIVSNGSSRTIFNRPMEEELFKVVWPVSSPKVILYDNHELAVMTESIKRYPLAIKVMDGDRFKEEYVPLMKEMDYLIVSQSFAYEATGIECLSENYYDVLKGLEKYNSKVVVVTLSSEGLIYLKDDKVVHVPSIKVNSVDPSGAGDVFHGAFCYGLCNNFALEDNLVFSSKVAALSTTKYGGQLSIPSKEEYYESE
ncbi:MAG: PfkB family carbohydrate kinase [Erysipelotrichaceae bacterium]